MPDWLNGSSGPVGWVLKTHRGVQFLDKVHVGEKQKRDVFHKKFSIRYNQQFEQVVRACADPSREGKTWITDELVDAYVALHRAGFAHSYECWVEDKLVGGAFGLQVGGWISVESMYHTVSNASKAAYVQTLLRLRERGFSFVDVQVVSPHMAYWGAQWIPQWRFEQLVRDAIRQPLTLTDDQRPARLPWRIRVGLPAVRLLRGLARRVLRRK
jgi:leucyl/phenylalanyl-tRNA--protein transferase